MVVITQFLIKFVCSFHSFTNQKEKPWNSFIFTNMDVICAEIAIQSHRFSRSKDKTISTGNLSRQTTFLVQNSLALPPDR